MNENIFFESDETVRRCDETEEVFTLLL